MARIRPEILDKFEPQVDAAGLDGLTLGQHAVFGLYQTSVSRQMLRERVKARRLHRIHQGVYGLVPEPLLTPQGRCMAAVLACGPGAALSHYSNLKLRGLMDASRTRIDVTVPTHNGRSRPAIRIHTSRTLRPQDIELVQGIPCTTLARTIFDMAEVLSPRRLEVLLDEAAYRELLDATALEEQIQHNRARRKACANLSHALTEHRAGSTRTDGPLGEAMLALIRATDLPDPKVQHWIDLDDGEPMIQADFAYPEAQVIIETDGQQAHGKPRRTAADYRRDQRAARAGWLTLRFTRQQIRGEPERVKTTLASVVTERLRPPRTKPPPAPPRPTRPGPAPTDPG